MKIILFGHQNWGLKTLEVLREMKHNILLVYTHPFDMDMHEKVWYESIKNTCKKNGIPVDEQKTVDASHKEIIQSMSPDLIISAGWRRLIPPEISQIPKYGTINMHEGLLPSYRGFAPINWAIINGEKEVGITVHYIDDTADTGDIILQKKIPIKIEDTAIEVYNKTLSIAPQLIKETLSMIESGQVKPIKQQNLEKGFFCSRRYPQDGKINWNNDRMKIYNLIRALCDPYPNAFCSYNSEIVHIKKAKLIDEDYRGPPGRICAIRDDGIIVTCGTDYTQNQGILITEISSKGKNFRPRDFFKKLWEDFD